MAKRREIYTINPSKKRKKRKTRAKPKAKKRKVQTMARKRKATTKRRRTYRRNPSKRRVKKSVRRVARRGFGGLSFRKALGNMPATQIGMFAAKWACKRFGSNATETDPNSWNWDSYLKGAVGAVGAGFLANMLKAGTGQKVLEGGLNFMVFKALQNEVISGSDWATAQFGASDDYVPDEYLLTGEDEDYFLGADGNAYPTDEMYRLPEAGYGDALQPVGPLGDTLQPVGPLGSVADRYRSAYNQQV